MQPQNYAFDIISVIISRTIVKNFKVNLMVLFLRVLRFRSRSSTNYKNSKKNVKCTLHVCQLQQRPMSTNQDNNNAKHLYYTQS